MGVKLAIFARLVRLWNCWKTDIGDLRRFVVIVKGQVIAGSQKLLLEPSSLGVLAALGAWPEVRTLSAHVVDALNLCSGSHVVPLLAASITTPCHRSLHHPLRGSKLPPHLLIELRLDDGVLDELVRVDLSESRLLRKISIALSEGELLLKLHFLVQL